MYLREAPISFLDEAAQLNLFPLILSAVLSRSDISLTASSFDLIKAAPYLGAAIVDKPNGEERRTREASLAWAKENSSITYDFADVRVNIDKLKDLLLLKNKDSVNSPAPNVSVTTNQKFEVSFLVKDEDELQRFLLNFVNPDNDTIDLMHVDGFDGKEGGMRIRGQVTNELPNDFSPYLSLIDIDQILTKNLHKSIGRLEDADNSHEKIGDSVKSPVQQRNERDGEVNPNRQKPQDQRFEQPLNALDAEYSHIAGHPCFRNIEGMTKSMFDLAKHYPHLVSLSDIGDSFLKGKGVTNTSALRQGYDIYALNITASESSRSTRQKGKVLFTAGVHAREYSPPELVMRFAEHLVQSYDVDADITWILNRNEIHIIVYVNPDGRYMAETNPSSLWRKNMNPGRTTSGGVNCSEFTYGVDINRNFDFLWGNMPGSSSYPCDSTYRGASPGSEPETRAVMDYALNLFPEEQRKLDPVTDMNVPFGEDIMGVFMDIHSPGGFTYYPWGHKNEACPDDEALQTLGRKLSSFNGYKLWAGGQPDFLYEASGDSSDFMYAELGVASLGLEIGERFFENCNVFEDVILPTNFQALLYSCKVATRPFSIAKGPDVLNLAVASISTSVGEIRVTAVASDNQLVNINGYPDFTTGDQVILIVQLYLDIHPDDYVGTNETIWDMIPVDNKLDSSEESVELVISTAGLSPGRHVIFVQAIDSDGYAGPVSSLFFVVEEAATVSPTQSPTSFSSPLVTAPPIQSNSPTISSPGPTFLPSNTPSMKTLSPTTSPIGSTSYPSTSSSNYLLTASPNSLTPTERPLQSPFAGVQTQQPTAMSNAQGDFSPTTAQALPNISFEPTIKHLATTVACTFGLLFALLI